MRRYYATLFFATLYLASCASAWITSAPLQNRAPSTTQLDAAAEPTSSRRTWFSQAAAIALTVPTVAHASTSAVVEKPVSGAVCDTAVSLWTNPQGRKVYILGTAHISSQSADVAGQLVRDVKPDAVFVELDAKRIGKAGTVVPTVSSSDSKSTEVATTASAARCFIIHYYTTTRVEITIVCTSQTRYSSACTTSRFCCCRKCH